MIYFGTNPERWKNCFPSRHERIVRHRPGREQIRPAGRHRRSAASTTAASASSAPPATIRPTALAAIPATRRNPAGRQDQHHRRRRPDGHDARHPRSCARACPASRSSPAISATNGWPRLRKLAEPLARNNQLTLRRLQSVEGQAGREIQLHRPDGAGPGAGRASRRRAAPKAIINIFAGIPADKTAEIDLDAYIEKQRYFIGTSGSTLEDMKRVLAKVVSRAARHQFVRRRGIPVWTARSTASAPSKRT